MVSLPPTTIRTSSGPTASSSAGRKGRLSAAAAGSGRDTLRRNAPPGHRDPASRPRGGLAPELLRAGAVAGTGAGQSGHRDLSSSLAERVPGAGRLRAAAVESLAARRPAHPVKPQLRCLLSSELAGAGGAAGPGPEPAGGAACGHCLRGGVVAGAPAWLPARRRGSL